MAQKKGRPLQSGGEGLRTGRQASTSESAPRGGMPSGSLRRGPPPGAPESQAPTPPIPGRPLQCLLPYSRRQSPAVTPLRHAVGLVQADERQLVRHPLQLLEERRRAPAFDGGWRATMGRPPPTHSPPPADGGWVGLWLTRLEVAIPAVFFWVSHSPVWTHRKQKNCYALALILRRGVSRGPVQ